jgi:hypothetical protein
MTENPGERMEAMMKEALSKTEIVDSLKQFRPGPLTRFFLSKMRESPISLNEPLNYGRLISSMVLHKKLGLKTNMIFEQRAPELHLIYTATIALVNSIRLNRTSFCEPHNNPVIDYVDEMVSASFSGAGATELRKIKEKYAGVNWRSLFSRDRWLAELVPSEHTLNSLGDQYLLTPRAHKALTELGLRPGGSYVRHHVVYGDMWAKLSIPGKVL